MIGELIPTGVTFGTGRKDINSSFSGTAEFNNIILDSGANFSAGTGGGAILSGGTDLYSIFGTGGGGSVTADNGLTAVGSNVSLGGTLTGDTLIEFGSNEILFEGGNSGLFVMSGDSAVDNQFVIINKNSNQDASLVVQAGKSLLTGLDSTGVKSSLLQATAGVVPGVLLQMFNGLATSYILIQESGMTISDSINDKGLIYASNYHANYTSRSIVDKEYVDNRSSSAVTTSAVHDYGTTSGVLDWNINSDSPNAKVTLNGNITSLNVLNATSGSFGTLKITQDGTGSRTITLGAGSHIVANGGAGAIKLTTNPGAVDIISFFYDGSEFSWSVGNDYN